MASIIHQHHVKSFIFLLIFQNVIFCQKLNYDKAKAGSPKYCDIQTGDPCDLNEYCKANESSDKIGECLCKPGFVRSYKPSSPCISMENFLTDDKKINTTVASMLEFTIEGPSEVTLPVDSVTLRVVPETSAFETLSYQWEVLEGAGLSTAKSYKSQELELSQLREGTLSFRVTVSDGIHSSSQERKLTVKPAVSVDMPPKAVIRPESPVRGVAGSTIILDAEGSTDDKKVVSYKWSQESGSSVAMPATSAAILKLENLLPGTYNFSVLVTDSSAQTSTASVTVEIYEERDDPPKAVATECGKVETGSITLRLPLEKIYLCGNSSTDDKGIASYNWFRIDELAGKLPIDGSGSTSPAYTLTNIQSNEQLGPYEFRLEVKDAKGQSDSTTIKVFVNKALNLPPEADAGGNRTLNLPENSIVLDANAKDDGTIVSYNWSQKSGPSTANILNADRAKATASELKEGVYEFQLIVIDDGGLNATAHAFITVQRGNNEPPIARAKNVTVKLPVGIVALNGSESTDDAGIVSYKWTVDDSVPASMMIVDRSDKQPIMFITGLVVGTHVYNLTVKDQQGEKGSTLIYLNVERGNEDIESVEIHMQSNISTWSQRARNKLETRIESALVSAIPEADVVSVEFVRFETVPGNGMLRTVFYAKSKRSSMRRAALLFDAWQLIEASRIVMILRKEYSMINEFSIKSISTLYCKLDCSGHGLCNDNTKQCECDGFWMTSLISLIHNDWRSEDCAWSSVYFLLFFIAIVSTFICFCFGRKPTQKLAALKRNARRRYAKKRRVYNALDSSDSDELTKKTRELLSGNRLQPLNLPDSDSLDSDYDVLLPKGKRDETELRERHSTINSQISTP